MPCARVSAITIYWWRATFQADSQARASLEAPKYLGVSDIWQVKKWRIKLYLANHNYWNSQSLVLRLTLQLDNVHFVL